MNKKGLRIKFDNTGMYLVDFDTGKKLTKTFELEEEILFSEIDHLIQSEEMVEFRAPEIVLKAIENILGIKPVRCEEGYSTFQEEYFLILVAYVKDHQEVKERFENRLKKARKESIAKREREKKIREQNASNFRKNIKR